MTRFVKSTGIHLNTKQPKGFTGRECFCVCVYMCPCVHAACLCFHLASVALRDPKEDKQFRKWMRGWRAHSSARQMHQGSSQISLGFPINKVIGDNCAIRGWVYPLHRSTTHRRACPCNVCHLNSEISGSEQQERKKERN